MLPQKRYKSETIPQNQSALPFPCIKRLNPLAFISTLRATNNSSQLRFALKLCTLLLLLLYIELTVCRCVFSLSAVCPQSGHMVWRRLWAICQLNLLRQGVFQYISLYYGPILLAPRFHHPSGGGHGRVSTAHLRSIPAKDVTLGNLK